MVLQIPSIYIVYLQYVIAVITQLTYELTIVIMHYETIMKSNCEQRRYTRVCVLIMCAAQLHLVQSLSSTGVFPKQFKLSSIIPLLKSTILI